MDCDASFDPRDLPRVADPVAAGDADLMLGARGARRPLHARLANRALAFELRRRTRRARCATSARCAPPAASRCSRSGCATAASAGRWRWCCARRRRAGQIREVPVAYLPREGRSKVTGTVRGTVRAVRDMTAVLG